VSERVASGASLTAYVDTTSTQPLLPTLPSPGAIATTTTNDELGITEWRLSNGVRVVLKPTTFKQEEVLFRAVSPGGTSLASDADFIPAATASMVAAQGGLGGLSRIDLCICDEHGVERLRLPDIPLQSGAGDVIYQESISYAKAMPTSKMIARLVTFDAAGSERVLGEYTFRHTRTLPGPGTA